MKYSDFIKIVAEESGTHPGTAKAVINSTMDNILRVVASSDEIKFPEFGKFRLKIRSARIGRNPRTGEKINVRETRDVTFKVLSQVKKDLNS